METTAVKTSAKTKWALDPTHSELAFKVRHMMITNVKGEFRNFDAALYRMEQILQSPLLM